MIVKVFQTGLSGGIRLVIKIYRTLKIHLLFHIVSVKMATPSGIR